MENMIQTVAQFKKEYPDIEILRDLSGDDNIRVHLTDTIVDGDLSLDVWNGYKAIYYLGDLTVKGDILYMSGEGGTGIGLFVKGRTSAGNIVVTATGEFHLNEVALSGVCVNDGYDSILLKIKTFERGILLNNNEWYFIGEIGKEATAFFDYEHEQWDDDNVFFMESFIEIFRGEPWIDDNGFEGNDEEYDEYDIERLFVEKPLQLSIARKTLDLEEFKERINVYRNYSKGI